MNTQARANDPEDAYHRNLYNISTSSEQRLTLYVDSRSAGACSQDSYDAFAVYFIANALSRHSIELCESRRHRLGRFGQTSYHLQNLRFATLPATPQGAR